MLATWWLCSSMGCPSVFIGIIFFGTNPSSLKYPGTMGEPFCVNGTSVFRAEKVVLGAWKKMFLLKFCGHFAGVWKRTMSGNRHAHGHFSLTFRAQALKTTLAPWRGATLTAWTPQLAVSEGLSISDSVPWAIQGLGGSVTPEATSRWHFLFGGWAAGSIYLFSTENGALEHRTWFSKCMCDAQR